MIFPRARSRATGDGRDAPRGVGRIAGAALLAALAIGTAGCAVKGADNANVIVGKQAFVAKCGSCHELARADTKGIVGPNLDEVFRTSLAEGLQRNAVRTVVEGQVQNPNPYGVMPKGLASGTTLTDISAYVAQSVDRSGPDTGLLASAVEAPGAGKPAVEKAGKLDIDANPAGQLAYTTTKAEATPGAVTIVMANMSGVSHNIAVEAGENGATQKAAPVGASSFITKGNTSVTVNLKPGKYTFFCQAPGHRAAGMYGTLTVK
ncbi:MAG: c-type cytochrome [Solirubrobacterales bacterium]|nr:c-type cytochrome [Solirubrobacterales bacterium]